MTQPGEVSAQELADFAFDLTGNWGFSAGEVHEILASAVAEYEQELFRSSLSVTRQLFRRVLHEQAVRAQFAMHRSFTNDYLRLMEVEESQLGLVCDAVLDTAVMVARDDKFTSPNDAADWYQRLALFVLAEHNAVSQELFKERVGYLLEQCKASAAPALRNRADAERVEEALQEASVKIFESEDKTRAVLRACNPTGYFYRFAINCLRSADKDSHPPSRRFRDSRYDPRQMNRFGLAFERSIGSLPDAAPSGRRRRLRSAFILHYYGTYQRETLHQKHVATVLQKDQSTVARWLKAARAELQSRLVYWIEQDPDLSDRIERPDDLAPYHGPADALEEFAVAAMLGATTRLWQCGPAEQQLPAWLRTLAGIEHWWARRRFGHKAERGQPKLPELKGNDFAAALQQAEDDWLEIMRGLVKHDAPSPDGEVGEWIRFMAENRPAGVEADELRASVGSLIASQLGGNGHVATL